MMMVSNYNVAILHWGAEEGRGGASVGISGTTSSSSDPVLC